MNKAFLCFALSLVTIPSCLAQKKVMQTVSDAPKLVEQKSAFLDRPLKDLLKEIEPKIVTVFGEPNGGITGTYLSFYFINRKHYNEMSKRGEEPLAIRVQFYPEKNPKRRPIPKDGITDWGEDDVQAYGDMKVARIRIVGGKKSGEK